MTKTPLLGDLTTAYARVGRQGKQQRGLGLPTGFHAVERAEIALGDTVVVQGSGPVGLNALVLQLVTREYPLGEASRALADMEALAVVKVLIRPGLDA